VFLFPDHLGQIHIATVASTAVDSSPTCSNNETPFFFFGLELHCFFLLLWLVLHCFLFGIVALVPVVPPSELFLSLAAAITSTSVGSVLLLLSLLQGEKEEDVEEDVGDDNSNNNDGGSRVVVGPTRVVLIGLSFLFVVLVTVFVLVIVAVLIGTDLGVVKGILVVVVPPKTTTVGRGASSLTLS
jgi:hypothetical protein